MADDSKTESPADIMRRAAKLMRERAEAVTHVFPWRSEGRDVTATQDYDGMDPDWDMGVVLARCTRQDEAEHIASWHPFVAAAVADLLEEVARQYDAPPCDSPDGVCNGCERREDFNDAARLADAYLREFPRSLQQVTA